MDLNPEPAGQAEDKAHIAISGRLVSVDALRGFDMFWIMGGGTVFITLAKLWENPVTETIRRQLSHVSWEGFHFQDLIFPLFMFIVGVVLPFSASRRLERGQSRTKVYLHIAKRAVVLILLGWIYSGVLKFNWAEMRWWGSVLQRIGMCYFFAAMLVMHTKWRTQAIVVVSVLVLYWAAMALIPVPGYGVGDFSQEGCLSSYIDQKVIPGKMYGYGFGENQGVISTLPAICTVLLGAMAGHWLRSGRTGNRKAAGLAIAGLVSLFAGYGWGMFFPVIKVIWTSSFVLVAGGWSLLLLALFYWVIDVKGYKKWAFFFIVIGMNPITIYLARRIVGFWGIAAFFLAGVAEFAGPAKVLVLTIGDLAVRWLFLWFLYRHKAFFKV